MHTTSIALWGDSISYGAWDEKDGGWVDRLRAFLHARTVASGFSDFYFFYNLGIPGDTTREALARFDAECAAREPSVALFALGINDSAHRGDRMNQILADETGDNARELVRRARNAGARALWIGLTAVDDARTTPFENNHANHYRLEEVRRYDAIIRAACVASGTPFLPLIDVLDRRDLSDGLHPDAQGHEKILNATRDFLKRERVI